jgi:hypothetical protein
VHFDHANSRVLRHDLCLLLAYTKERYQVSRDMAGQAVRKLIVVEGTYVRENALHAMLFALLAFLTVIANANTVLANSRPAQGKVCSRACSSSSTTLASSDRIALLARVGGDQLKRPTPTTSHYRADDEARTAWDAALEPEDSEKDEGADAEATSLSIRGAPLQRFAAQRTCTSSVVRLTQLLVSSTLARGPPAMARGRTPRRPFARGRTCPRRRSRR